MTAADRTAPSVPAAEDEAVERVARALRDERWESRHRVAGFAGPHTPKHYDPDCPLCRPDLYDGYEAIARAALDAAGVAGLTAEASALRADLVEARDGFDRWRGIANDLGAERDEARQQVADLREALSILRSEVKHAEWEADEAWRGDPTIDNRTAVARRDAFRRALHIVTTTPTPARADR